MTGSVFEAMVQFFRDDEWNFQQLEDKPIIRLGFSGNNGNWTCYGRARDKQEQFLFYSIMETKVPEDKRLAVAEFITRANYGMIIGNFEMDFSDGEVRYKTSIDVEGGELTPKMFRNLVYPNVRMMDRYLPGIMRVIYGGATPEQAIAEIEG